MARVKLGSSMATKPKMIFDTNVCGKLSLSPYLPYLAEIQSRLARRFTLWASPNTFMELLDSIKGGTGAQFEIDKERLRVMAGQGQLRFLEMPITFALKTVLGVKAPLVNLAPADLKDAFKIVIRAKTRDDLFTGQVRKTGSSGRRYGIDPDLVSGPQAIGEAQHVASLQQLKEGKALFPPPERWAADMAKDVGCVLTTKQSQKLAASLEAAHTYESQLYSLMKAGYNAQKNANDWIDSQQLFYLCDSDLYLVTDDKKLRDRCTASDQSKRIILLKELPALLGIKV
jgi:hypothetical protein